MEYQKIVNLLDNTINQPTKFRRRNCAEINDKSRGMYNTNSQIKLKTLILRSSLWNYSDEHVIVSGTITVAEVVAGEVNSNIQVVFKKCAPFTDCINEIINK